jgi:hypothetical protein
MDGVSGRGIQDRAVVAVVNGTPEPYGCDAASGSVFGTL